MASNAQQKANADDQSAWAFTLTAADFEIPSQKTPVALVASAIAEIVFDVVPNTSIPKESTSAKIQLLDTAVPENDDALGSIIDQVLQGWGSDNNDLDTVYRKVAWPFINPDDYRPAVNADQRIIDNIEAIKLVKSLSQDKRQPTQAEMAQLLRYSGWGGVSRVFSPDGSTPQPFAHLRDELMRITSEKEYAAMLATVNTAFFTDPVVSKALWDIVERLGFKGGLVLEPAAGGGHIIAHMPTHLAEKSDVTAVEIDPITASMLETNFAPYGLQVHACGLEDAKLPAGAFDLVIGNVPFGKFKTNDTTKASYSDWSIHNWFFGKSVDLVRPGGLIVLITTTSTMDSATSVHRSWLGAHADLLGAIRLPTMAFETFAGTSAVTDILVLRRKEFPNYSASCPWVNTNEASSEHFLQGEPTRKHSYNRSTGRSESKVASINSHFSQRPEAIVGKLAWKSGQYGEKALPVFDGSIEELGNRLIDVIAAEIPQGVYVPRQSKNNEMPISPMVRYANHGNAMPGSFVLRQGSVCISEGDELLEVDSLYTGTTRKRLLGMMDIRDKALAVIEHQVDSDDDQELQVLQRHLNASYDSFVAQMGFLCTSANSRVMRGDPNWPLMLALEIWNEEDAVAEKADIFTKRTVGKVNIPERVESVKDAMLISLSLYGKIVLKDMAMRLASPVMEVVKELKATAIAFRDPMLARWVPADEYLSGNIREKISQAKAAGAAYEQNISALETVIPADLGPAQVEVRLGAPWIPVDVVTQFSQELVNANDGVITVAYDSTTATWSVKGGYRLEYVGDRTLQTVKWGTSSRCALTLVEAALNQQPPTVTVTVDGKSCTDPVATMNAREKWQAIRDHFRQWVYQDEDRRDRLLRIYNDAFNQIVTRRFDGSHLQLPGLSASVIPYQHQKDAIWRIVMNGNTLLAHCVGAGKTLTMIAAGMEMRRLGKARKPCHVVPNHLLADYVGEVKRFYPQSRVLMATKEDVNGDKRRTFVARVATGDWDAVVMTMSTFERLMPSIEKQQGFIDSMLAEARMMLNLTKDRGAQRTIKELERRMKDYEAKLTRLVENGKADEKAVWFDELGIDALFIDEAHALKNLGRMSKMPRIAGLPNVASQRAFDAFMKTRMIMEARGGAEEGVVFATATPVTNSLAELYTMQVFLQPKTLKKYGVYEFDAWSASFGESVTGIELSPDGGGFRTNTRYARFVNLPELMGIFRGVADVRTKKMLNLPTPTIEGGKPQTMVAKSSDALKAITAELVERAEKIRSGSVEPSVDNMLSVTNDGRRAALDVRMVDPSKPADPQGKLAMVVSNVHRIWESGSQERLTQLVFCDLGTPGAPGFSVYEEIRRGLLDKGIPLSEIEFIHDHDSDAAKAKLFKRVRTGQVRVLMGSTQKLGTGTNVQRLLKAVHQVDAPWVPSSVEQRDGRADRQGNECASIELWRYVTEGSFDAYSWNLLDVKSRFIDQVMTADQGLRSVEDISMTALTYAEIKAIASGNPLVLEKATVDAKVQKLSLQLDHWEQDRWRMSRRKVELTQRLGWIDANMASIEQEKELAKAVLANAVFKPGSAVAKDAVHEHMPREMAIGQAFEAVAKARTHGVMGSLNGFKLETERVLNVSELYVVSPLTGTAVLVDRPAMNMHADVGRAVLKTVAEFEKRVASLMDEYGRKVQERNGIETMLGQAFEHGQELEQARVRQRQIEAELDLDKSATGSDAMTAEAA